MNKQAQYNFRGLRQDLAKNKHSNEFYFEGQHIKILSTDSQSTSSITNEKGNSLILTFPKVTIGKTINYQETNISSNILSSTININSQLLITPLELKEQLNNGLVKQESDNHTLLGYAIGRNSVILFTTDEGTDCIWELNNILEENFTLKLLYVRNLNFNINNPIQAIYNYENENIQKVYWVDGLNQIRFLNTRHENIEENEPLIQTPLNSLNFVGNVNFTQPKIIDKISGGIHTSGMIQYAYNLYRLNSSQTKLSPLSELIPLDKGQSLGGGEINEIVSETPIIKIDNLDNSYTHIKVYAIKYTSQNQIPAITLIDEREINSENSITVYDDGRNIDTLSLEEFIFLGSDPIIPKHIETKENRLFPSNIKNKEFVLPEELDTRLYSFNQNQKSVLLNTINNTVSVQSESGSPNIIYRGEGTGEINVNSTYSNIPRKHSAINKNYYSQKYQSDGITLGAEGKFFKAELLQLTENELSKNSENLKFLKDDEIYRFAIEFYNNLGQVSLPLWMFDYVTPKGNLKGNYNCLKVELKQEFYNWLDNYNFLEQSDKPVGYRILRANRRELDKTIIAQGFINGMIANHPNSTNKLEYEFGSQSEEVKNAVHNSSAILPSLQRVWNKKPINERQIKQIKPIGNYKSLSNPTNNQKEEETFNDFNLFNDNRNYRAENFQFNSIMQFFSPEILFNNIRFNNNLKLEIKGMFKNSFNSGWAQAISISTREKLKELKVNSGLTNYDFNFNLNNPLVITNTTGHELFDYGILGPSGSPSGREMDFALFNREFKGNYTEIPNNTLKKYSIYNKPQITERGQGEQSYNNDSKFNYYNTLVPFLSDRKRDSILQRINTFSAKNATIVLGPNNIDLNIVNRPTLDTIFANLENNNNLDVEDSLLITEITKPKETIYTGNLYGGNTYEDKLRTDYLQIGNYKNINDNEIIIENSGDIFVQNFKLLKLGPTDTEILDGNSFQISEIVETKVETQIDLKNRNDKSLNNWDSEFQPNYDEYHKYNNVYSQQSNLIRNTNLDFTFRRIKQFDTRIQSTKLKIPNESIDSWTDVLANETIDLDGKYGPINNIVSFKDNIYTFQDEAIAGIQINPRVQVQANDGIGIELGTGNILYNYKYLTTKSGSSNKWGIIPTKKGIYYYDIINKGIGRVPNEVSPLLSDIKQMHFWFNNNHNYELLSKDNPLINQGVVFGVDNYNHDVYFTFLQDKQSYTRCFNEFADEFIDLKTYLPKFYINKGNILLIENNNKLYQQYTGEYNNFFGEYKSSYVTLLLNPASNQDTIFNNVFYNSELYLNDIDQPDKTLTHIQAFNEYQDSGRIPLIIGRDKNLRRKFREWKANIPRTGRNRIRNPWIYLKLELENESNYKMILHDIIINYSI